MRSHVDTHPEFDFAIGYVRPRRTYVKMCEDCRQRPARRNLTVCFACGNERERNALMRTIGTPFPI